MVLLLLVSRSALSPPNSSLLLMDVIQREILRVDVFQRPRIRSILLMIPLLEWIMYPFQSRIRTIRKSTRRRNLLDITMYTLEVIWVAERMLRIPIRSPATRSVSIWMDNTMTTKPSVRYPMSWLVSVFAWVRAQIAIQLIRTRIDVLEV